MREKNTTLNSSDDRRNKWTDRKHIRKKKQFKKPNFLVSLLMVWYSVWSRCIRVRGGQWATFKCNFYLWLWRERSRTSWIVIFHHHAYFSMHHSLVLDLGVSRTPAFNLFLFCLSLDFHPCSAAICSFLLLFFFLNQTSKIINFQFGR